VKICQIIDACEPYTGGGSGTYTKKLASRMAGEHQVLVITQRPYHGLASLKPEIEIRDNVKIYRFYPLNFYFTYSSDKVPFWIKPFWHLLNIWNPHPYFVIKGILEKEMPDVVHVHTIGGFSLSVFSAVKSLGYPLVRTLHGYDLLSPWSALMRRGRIIRRFNLLERQFIRVTRYFSRSIDLALFPSQFIMDMYAEHKFFPNSRCLKLIVGTELDGSETVGKDYQTIDILYTGWLNESKGAHVLIEGFKKLSGDNVRLHIVGRGYYEKELRLIAGSDSRIFFHGFMPREQLDELYRKSNVAVVPSLFYENAPSVILDSFKAGMPVIASRIGGIPETIEDGYNGRLFEPGNSEELKEILESLISNPAELKRLGDGAWQSLKKYDFNEHVQKLVALYQEAKTGNTG